MILRFLPTAGGEERRAAGDLLEAMDVDARDMGEFLLLGRVLTEDEAARLGALPGVASVAPADPSTVTLRESLLRWTAAACLALGILVLLASNLPVGLGAPADPLRTPAGLRPPWPMLGWYALDDRLPPGAPFPLLVLLACAALLAWPFLARRLAERHAVLHAAVGLAALAAGIGLALLGAAR
jgi:hypothetical protein